MCYQALNPSLDVIAPGAVIGHLGLSIASDFERTALNGPVNPLIVLFVAGVLRLHFEDDPIPIVLGHDAPVEQQEIGLRTRPATYTLRLRGLKLAAAGSSLEVM